MRWKRPLARSGSGPSTATSPRSSLRPTAGRNVTDNGGFGPDPAPLMAEIARRGWEPTFICESAGTQAEDAKTMKELYLQAQ